SYIFFLFSLYSLLIFFFFFSSRRRHTRFSRDWSSDVCSSDLSDLDVAHAILEILGKSRDLIRLNGATSDSGPGIGDEDHLAFQRSEERRVGKECRSRWSVER